AEDGIRDKLVTGVQTCALPISVCTTVDTPAAAAETTEMLCWQGTLTGPTDPQLAKFAEFREGRSTVPVDMSAVDRIDFVCAGARSEERRVGKECRARWWPCHET